MSEMEGYTPCSYAPFKNREYPDNRDFINLKIQKILEVIGPVKEIKSDYLSTTSYYYNDNTNAIYAISNTSGELLSTTQEEINHLRKLNSLRNSN
jgi:hypothetical protein